MKIDTQGMTIPIDIKEKKVKGKEYSTFISNTQRVKKIPMINDIMREELKEIINEVLDERERRYEREDDSWLYRGTY